MRKSLTTNTFRKRAGIAAAGVAALAAVAVPGVAWATDAVPQGVTVDAATAVQGDAKACAEPIKLSDEELQKLIADGTAVPATLADPAGLAQSMLADGPMVTGTPDGVSETKILSDEDVQRMIADGTMVQATPMTDAPAGATERSITVTRNC